MGSDQLERNASSKVALSTPNGGNKSHKRKRPSDGSAIAPSTPTPSKKHKKDNTDQQESRRVEDSGRKKKKDKSAVVSREDEEDMPRKASVASPSRRDSKSTAGREHDDQSTGKPNSARKKNRSDGAGAIGAPPKPTAGTADTEEDEAVSALNSRHSRIWSKFEKSRKVAETIHAKQAKQSSQDSTKQDVLAAEPVIAQGLEPLPQPEAAPEQLEKPTYSSLPAWLAEPLRVLTDQRKQFSELGIDATLLKILEENGYKEAFAVQSAVIPLLLRGSKRHPGDLCISAATGSGKTLSYVLPLVTDLQPFPAPRLRGLIVVPTRELVRQARDACELCAAGSRLRIGSAVGNVAIKDEQGLLMRVDQVYAPESFRAQQNKGLTGDDWAKFSLMDYLTECEDRKEMLPDYIVKSEPNVDILICTPGRLVDHLRYTKGFTLEHLQWLVIDEADRLLNESFQEWVDVVMRSLDARKVPESHGFAGNFLAGVSHPILSKEPRKVVLSATMTRDITKLNSLRLSNPKLVVIGGADDAMKADDAEGGQISRPDAQFALPSTLKEFAVAVGDGSKKPLYLLRLLLSRIKVDISTENKRPLSDASSDSEDTSSDESDSDESTSTNSDSKSDSESDSSSSVEDSSSSESGSASETSASDDESPDFKTKALKVTDNTSTRTTVLIFTKSSESASRLSRLLSLLNPSLASQVGTIVKSNKSSASRRTLSAYRRGKISIIVATDRASRGLDLQSLTHVINYDVPTSVTSYVHRVGRTARAGKRGTAWTLVAHREGRWFANEIVKGSDGMITRTGNVEKVNVNLDDVDDTLQSEYEAALDALEGEVKTGGKGKPATSRA